VPNTLFVVDDSVTMRKVFDMTFAGEDVTVVSHDGSESALAKFREVKPQAAIIDVALGASTGYDLVRSIRADAAGSSIPIYLLYSEQSPLDEAAARSCGALGAIIKPFESQVIIDKVRQALTSVGQKPSVTNTTGHVTAPFGNPQASAPAPIGAIPSPSMKSSTETAVFSAPRPAGGVLAGTANRSPAASSPTNRTAATTSSSGTSTPATTGAPVATRPVAPPPPLPTAQPVARPAVPIAAVSPAATTAKTTEKPIIEEEAVQFEGEGGRSIPAPAPTARTANAGAALTQTVAKAVAEGTSNLGLTAAQIEAVTALTRDVVERVVWEVVPQLAEVMIREELARLTAE
jgi:CheY-like chemotaxis protein